VSRSKEGKGKERKAGRKREGGGREGGRHVAPTRGSSLKVVQPRRVFETGIRRMVIQRIRRTSVVI